MPPRAGDRRACGRARPPAPRARSRRARRRARALTSSASSAPSPQPISTSVAGRRPAREHSVERVAGLRGARRARASGRSGSPRRGRRPSSRPRRTRRGRRSRRRSRRPPRCARAALAQVDDRRDRRRAAPAAGRRACPATSSGTRAPGVEQRRERAGSSRRRPVRPSLAIGVNSRVAGRAHAAASPRARRPGAPGPTAGRAGAPARVDHERRRRTSTAPASARPLTKRSPTASRRRPACPGPRVEHRLVVPLVEGQAADARPTRQAR